MKSLVFNLLVVGALAFLLFDGTPPAGVRDAVDKVAAKADRMLDKGKEMVAKRPAQSEAEPAPAVTPEPEPAAHVSARQPRTEKEQAAAAVSRAPARPVAKAPAAPEKVVKAPIAEAPKPAPQAPRPDNPSPVKATQVAAAPAPKLDPAVARRRAEILGEIPDGAARTPEPSPEFMTPRARRAELHRLAEDMELMFVDKANR